MNYSPDMNNGKNVFVFGSNEAGLHAGGAAYEAHKNWGAKLGCGFGRFGDSFAIPTMNWKLEALSLKMIEHYVQRFLAYAERCPDKTFLVTAIGTGICGYSHAEIAPMFKNAPSNCVLPDEWKNL